MARIKITKETLNDFFSNYAKRNSIKLSVKDRALIVEAYRRKFMMKAYDVHLGLGTITQYKSEYFVPSYDREYQPRVANWYTLSEKGFEILNEMKKVFNLPKTGKKLNDVEDVLWRY